MSQTQNQPVSLVVVQPFAILEAVLNIAGNGGSASQKIKIREDAEFVVTHIDTDVYDQKGRISESKHAPFTLALRNTTQTSDFQNQAFNLHALRSLSQAKHFGMIQFSGNQEIEITASHDGFSAGNLDVAPYQVRVTFVGFYARYHYE